MVVAATANRGIEHFPRWDRRAGECFTVRYIKTDGRQSVCHWLVCSGDYNKRCVLKFPTHFSRRSLIWQFVFTWPVSSVLELSDWFLPSCQIFPLRRPETCQIEVCWPVRGDVSVFIEYFVTESHECHIPPGTSHPPDKSGHKTETDSSYNNSCGERSQCRPSVVWK